MLNWCKACGQDPPKYSDFRRSPAYYLTQWQAKIPPREKELLRQLWTEKED